MNNYSYRVSGSLFCGIPNHIPNHIPNYFPNSLTRSQTSLFIFFTSASAPTNYGNKTGHFKINAGLWNQYFSKDFS